MSHRDESERELGGEDRRWVDVVARVFAPEPLDPLRARAFDRRLFARLEPRARRRWLALPVLAAAGAALALWLDAGTQAPPDRAATSLHAFADPDAGLGLVEPDDYLPDDYLLLASAIEDDADAR